MNRDHWPSPFQWVFITAAGIVCWLAVFFVLFTVGVDQ